jgi:hypothetical protein
MLYRARTCAFPILYKNLCVLNKPSLLRMLRNMGGFSIWGWVGCRLLATGTNDPDTQTEHNMETTNCPMIDALMDDAGVISWEDACRVAASHSLYQDFIGDWWAKCCHNYDAGLSAQKLAYWLGY